MRQAIPQPRVLLVEDDEGIRFVLSELLEMIGVPHRAAPTAEVALELLESGLRPNLILLDLTLPGMSGKAMIGKLKEHRDFSDIPVVLISGYDVDPGPLRANDHLLKPITLPGLMRVLDSYIGDRS